MVEPFSLLIIGQPKPYNYGCSRVDPRGMPGGWRSGSPGSSSRQRGKGDPYPKGIEVKKTIIFSLSSKVHIKIEDYGYLFVQNS